MRCALLQCCARSPRHERCSHDASSRASAPRMRPALWLSIAKGLDRTRRPRSFRATDHAAVNRSHKDGLKALAASTASRGCAATTVRRTTPRPASIRRQQTSRPCACAERRAFDIQFSDNRMRCTWHPFARKRSSARARGCVGGGGESAPCNAPGSRFRGRLPARRRRSDRHLRHGLVGGEMIVDIDDAARRLVCPSWRAADAPQRIAAGVCRGGRAQPGRVDRDCCPTTSPDPSAHDGPWDARHCSRRWRGRRAGSGA